MARTKNVIIGTLVLWGMLASIYLLWDRGLRYTLHTNSKRDFLAPYLDIPPCSEQPCLPVPYANHINFGLQDRVFAYDYHTGDLEMVQLPAILKDSQVPDGVGLVETMWKFVPHPRIQRPNGVNNDSDSYLICLSILYTSCLRNDRGYLVLSGLTDGPSTWTYTRLGSRLMDGEKFMITQGDVALGRQGGRPALYPITYREDMFWTLLLVSFGQE